MILTKDVDRFQYPQVHSCHEEEVDEGLDAKDIQQSRWMFYDVPEGVDDKELDAEVKVLEDELEIGDGRSEERRVGKECPV